MSSYCRILSVDSSTGWLVRTFFVRAFTSLELSPSYDLREPICDPSQIYVMQTTQHCAVNLHKK